MGGVLGRLSPPWTQLLATGLPFPITMQYPEQVPPVLPANVYVPVPPPPPCQSLVSQVLPLPLCHPIPSLPHPPSWRPLPLQLPLLLPSPTLPHLLSFDAERVRLHFHCSLRQSLSPPPPPPRLSVLSLPIHMTSAYPGCSSPDSQRLLSSLQSPPSPPIPSLSSYSSS